MTSTFSGSRCAFGIRWRGNASFRSPPTWRHLLSWLPRRPNNPYVFTSPGAASGRLQDARANHTRALKIAGLPHVTLHGLRRSFSTLSEWVEVPVGVVAQIQGLKPSDIAEKHYRVRPLDLLRMWHERIEAWMLDQAGIDFKPKVDEEPALQVVTAHKAA